VKADAAVAGEVGTVLRDWLPRIADVDRSAWLTHITELKGDSAVRDIQNLPDDGHLYAAHVINDIWRITEGRALVVTDVGQHQMWEAQYYKHETSRSLITSGGLGTMGFALPAAIGAKVGRPDAEGLGGRRRRRLPDDVPRACDDGAGRARRQDRDHQQRVPGDGPAVAGVLLPAPVRRDAHLRARLQEAAEAFGVFGTTVTTRGQVAGAVAAARSHRGALIDFQVEQEDSVYPMVPAGADLHKMIRRPSPIVETAAD
jgi:acetolactate synthase-1/2/3 large subunit